MKLLFKQRFFTWLDSYDIYDELGETVYTVEGKLSWGHRLQISRGNEMIGEIREQVMSFMPRFQMYYKESYLGMIEKKFSFFRPEFHLDYNDWRIEGDIWEWNYEVHSGSRLIMRAEKQLFNFTDTYVLDIIQPEDQVMCLMIVLAIDAAKCSQNK